MTLRYDSMSSEIGLSEMAPKRMPLGSPKPRSMLSSPACRRAPRPATSMNDQRMGLIQKSRRMKWPMTMPTSR